MSSLDERPLPPAALIGAGLLILTTITGVGIIQLNKHFHPPAPVAEIANANVDQMRALRFVDMQDGVSVYGGHVRIFDVATGAELPQLRDNDGFIRSVLNALAYERTKRGITAPPVYTLKQWSNGAITVEDPATSMHIDVGSFGAGNKKVFLRFFAKKGAKA